MDWPSIVYNNMPPMGSDAQLAFGRGIFHWGILGDVGENGWVALFEKGKFSRWGGWTAVHVSRSACRMTSPYEQHL